MPAGDDVWERNRQRAVTAAQHCADCGLCEPTCPYEVPIVEFVRRVATSA